MGRWLTPTGHRQLVGAMTSLLLLPLLIGGYLAAVLVSSGHSPKATNLPFGVSGSSPVLAAAEKSISLKVSQYPPTAA